MPYLLILSVLFSLFAIDGFTRINFLSENITKLKWEYENALEETTLFINKRAEELSTNQVISQNLDWSMTNSVTQFADSQLEAGKIDFIQIYDEKCALLISASHIPQSWMKCPSEQYSAAKNSVTPFAESEGGPIISRTILMTSPSGKRRYLTTGVCLNENWTKQTKRLAFLFANLNISIVNTLKQNDKTIVHEGIEVNKSLKAPLASSNKMVAFTSMIQKIPALTVKNIVLACHGLTFTLAIIIAFLSVRSEKRQELKNKDFLSWSGSLNRKNTKERESETAGGTKYPPLIEAQNLITEAFQKQADTINLLTREIQSLHVQRGSIEEALLKAREQLLLATHHESFTKQLQTHINSFAQKIQDIISGTEDISDTLAHGIRVQTTQLSNIIGEWKWELQNQSPRKFFRSLSEIQREDGSNALEHTLQKVISAVNTLSTQSISSSLSTQKILTQLQEVTNITNHWRSMCDKSHDAPRKTKLKALLLESHQLAQMVPNIPQYNLNIILEESLSVEKIAAPSATITSAVYHIFLSLLETAKAIHLDKLELKVSSKIKNDVTILIMSIAQPGRLQDDSSIHSTEKSQYNLDVAHQLLQPYQINVLKLPTIKGLSAVIMSWKDRLETDVKQLESRSKNPLQQMAHHDQSQSQMRYQMIHPH